MWNHTLFLIRTIYPTDPTSITQAQGVERSNSKHLSIRSPGKRGDGIFVDWATVQQAPKRIPHLVESKQMYPTHGNEGRAQNANKQKSVRVRVSVCVFICLGSLRKWECMRMYMLMRAFYPLTCVPHSTNKGNRFTLYRQSSAPEIMRLLTAFQSTVSMTPSWAFHCTKQTIHSLEKITILTKAFTNLSIELSLLTWAFAKLCVITWICFTTASQN